MTNSEYHYAKPKARMSYRIPGKPGRRHKEGQWEQEERKELGDSPSGHYKPYKSSKGLIGLDWKRRIPNFVK